ncbi:hypothetical protein SODALDRAFT_334533 [Sodiomyces alkalinus F11]|uniref:Uncharacterized protein n=1 Tax=Sodiomyces alkalinus (strain CBS 110278 / VKM F-3762 / F11) TaxID=1314773 RepID=A0A3N2PSF6_SODAK|nr:hypothetical protein SODALDRAFT_334533 [Sodiomyces alkalinus F11]ROT37435.1 hypothetical protein SODALDRAFT_334533 [Sodiomyces alkalinus F11]
MTNLILYETTPSVLEILWDVALAYFIICMGTIYTALTLTTSALLTYLRAALPLWLVPGAGAEAGVGTVTTVLISTLRILLAAACARYIIVRYEMPRDWKFRAVVCCVAAVMTAATAALVGWIVPGRLLGGWVSEAERGAMIAGFMPLALMPLEGGTRSWLDGAVLRSKKAGY